MRDCEQKKYQNQDLQDDRMNMIKNRNPENLQILKIKVQTNDMNVNLKLLGYA